MKILAISDIHGIHDAAEKINNTAEKYEVDLVIISGDITTFGPASYAENLLNKIKIQTLAIPGNCDPPEVNLAIKNSKALNLHKKKEIINDNVFVGLGGGAKNFVNVGIAFTEREIYCILNKLIEKESILVVHQPAYGQFDCVNGRHTGSQALQKIIDKYEPILVISGHIHEDYGFKSVNNTVFLNPGSLKDDKAALINFRKKKIDINILTL